MKPLKLHISPCPNDTFMFDALINGRIDCHPFTFEVEYHDIEELNAELLNSSSQVDISKVSCALLPTIAPRYTLLECGAALGRGNGPLLIKRRGHSAPLNHVAVPGLHTTAAALLTTLCPEVKQLTPLLFSQIAQAVERGEFDAGVLIHEGRFVYAERNLELVADLGLLWEERFAMPLPLGGIVMRSEIEPAVRLKFQDLLRRSIKYAMDNPLLSREFVKSHAQELSDEVIEKHIALFVNEFSLDLGHEGHRALEAMIFND